MYYANKSNEKYGVAYKWKEFVLEEVKKNNDAKKFIEDYRLTILEANELFFFEFFLSLFFVAGGSSIVLRKKRFSSIAEILFKISFVNLIFINL